MQMPGGGEDSSPPILILDDEIELHHLLHVKLSPRGYSITSAYSAADALKQIDQRNETKSPFKLILADVNLPEGDGFEFLRQLKSRSPQIPVVMMTAHGSARVASQALTMGAQHFILKPLDLNYLASVIEKTLERDQNRHQQGLVPGLIGHSPRMQATFHLIRKVAPTPASVLVSGESGSGKELVARAIHDLSPRALAPFVAVNCAAIPNELLESELFGHVKGAFTGALEPRRGLFEEADGGTIFLDEIGDLPLNLQAKILRLIQTKEVRPLGKNISYPINVRIIAATHKNLRRATLDGEFREDLYFRLNVIPIHVPALRERPDDIPILAQHFLGHFNRQFGTRKYFAPRALARMMTMPWAGNVRELENSIQRALVLSEGEEISEHEISFEEDGSCEFSMPAAEFTLEQVERLYIAHVLKATGGIKEKATKILGIDRKTLYRKEKKYGLTQSIPSAFT